MIEKVRRSTAFVEDSTSSNLGDYVEIRDEGVCGFTEPFRLSWFLTITGAEYFHVYLWIAKDFSWTQEFKTLSLFFGTIATLWCIVIFFNAFRVGNNDEVYSTVALFMWIFANYWWMTGDVHDDNYPDEESIYDQRAGESAIILLSAVCWLTLYYFVVIPFSVMPVSPEAIAAYDDGVYKPRFHFLKTFRQYENLHMYFWLIKDLCWNLNYVTMWFFMLVPALFLAGDFIFISAFCKNSVVDTVHYATIFLWVCGNVIWALGEFFFTEYDEPIRIWHGSAEARKTARWYSSWILFASFVPIIALYSVWIPLTLMGKLDNIGEREEEEDVSFDNEDPKSSEWYRPLLHPDGDTDTYDPYPPSSSSVSFTRNPLMADTKHPKSILKVKSSPVKKTPVDTCRSGNTNKSKKSAPLNLDRETTPFEKSPVKHRIRFNFPPPVDPAPYIPDSEEEISGSDLIPNTDTRSSSDPIIDTALSSDRDALEIECVDGWDRTDSKLLPLPFIYFDDDDCADVQRSTTSHPI